MLGPHWLSDTWDMPAELARELSFHSVLVFLAVWLLDHPSLVWGWCKWPDLVWWGNRQTSCRRKIHFNVSLADSDGEGQDNAVASSPFQVPRPGRCDRCFLAPWHKLQFGGQLYILLWTNQELSCGQELWIPTSREPLQGPVDMGSYTTSNDARGSFWPSCPDPPLGALGNSPVTPSTFLGFLAGPAFLLVSKK